VAFSGDSNTIPQAGKHFSDSDKAAPARRRTVIAP